MTPLTFLAFALLCCPRAEPPGWLVRAPAFQEATRLAMIDLDLMGPSETLGVLDAAWGPGVNSTFSNLQNLVALAWRLPHSDQAERFRQPDGLPFELLQFNRRLQDTLEVRRDLEYHNRAAYDALLDECRRLYAVHDAADDLQKGLRQGDRLSTRIALGRLRDLLGPDEWESGRLPPSVPVWLLPRE